MASARRNFLFLCDSCASSDAFECIFYDDTLLALSMLKERVQMCKQEVQRKERARTSTFTG
jgi:hypothetical protein